jgi:hypothetical protein
MNRVYEEPRHRLDVDLVDALARRERDSVCHHELAKRCSLDARDNLSRQHGVDDIGFHRDSATLEYEARRSTRS